MLLLDRDITFDGGAIGDHCSTQILLKEKNANVHSSKNGRIEYLTDILDRSDFHDCFALPVDCTGSQCDGPY
jgi:hypothetical protein